MAWFDEAEIKTADQPYRYNRYGAVYCWENLKYFKLGSAPTKMGRNRWSRIDFFGFFISPEEDFSDLHERGEPYQGGKHGDITLEDYWRRDPVTGVKRTDEELIALGELIAEPNLIEKDSIRYWHIAHVPMLWPRSLGAAKSEWNDELRKKLRDIIDLRISQGSPSDYRYFTMQGPDGRAQLDGCVLLHSPESTGGKRAPIYISAKNTKWHTDLLFRSQIFATGSDFTGSIFQGKADFSQAHFEGELSFANCHFEKDAVYEEAIFDGPAIFQGARFARAILNLTEFNDNASFIRTSFSKHATFKKAKFNSSGSFAHAKFFSTCDFELSQLSASVRFNKSTFISNDTNWIPLAVGSLLSTIVFLILLQFAPMTANHSQPWWHFTNWLHDILILVTWVAAYYAVAALAAVFWGLDEDTSYLDEQIESFRNLKQLCAASGNHQGELYFHALELKTSRKAPISLDDGSIVSQVMRKSFSRVYELTSDYGMSIARPLASLFILTFLFSLLFWSWEGGGLSGNKSDMWKRVSLIGVTAQFTYDATLHKTPDVDFAPVLKLALPIFSWKQTHYINGVKFLSQPFDPAFVESLGLSTRNIFRPFGVWNAEFVQDEGHCGFQSRLLVLGQSDGVKCMPVGTPLNTPADVAGHKLLVRLAATLQSILSGMVLFLFGLSVRRQFQIS